MEKRLLTPASMCSTPASRYRQSAAKSTKFRCFGISPLLTLVQLGLGPILPGHSYHALRMLPGPYSGTVEKTRRKPGEKCNPTGRTLYYKYIHTVSAAATAVCRQRNPYYVHIRIRPSVASAWLSIAPSAVSSGLGTGVVSVRLQNVFETLPTMLLWRACLFFNIMLYAKLMSMRTPE